MMLNKQFLALAFAAGATFLVGCEDDDAADSGECAGLKFDEAALPTSGECFDCLTDGVTPAPAVITPLAATKAAVDKWNGCGVPFTDACAGMAKITEAGKVANEAAGGAEITASATANKFDADDAAKNTLQATSCSSCFIAHVAASTETADDKKATDAFKKCGVEVEIAVAS